MYGGGLENEERRDAFSLKKLEQVLCCFPVEAESEKEREPRRGESGREGPILAHQTSSEEVLPFTKREHLLQHSSWPPTFSVAV